MVDDWSRYHEKLIIENREKRAIESSWRISIRHTKSLMFFFEEELQIKNFYFYKKDLITLRSWRLSFIFTFYTTRERLGQEANWVEKIWLFESVIFGMEKCYKKFGILKKFWNVFLRRFQWYFFKGRNFSREADKTGGKRWNIKLIQQPSQPSKSTKEQEDTWIFLPSFFGIKSFPKNEASFLKFSVSSSCFLIILQINYFWFWTKTTKPHN